MLQSKSSRRYAAAVYGLAQETGCASEFLADLDAIEDRVRQTPALAHFLGDYAVPRPRRSLALEALFRDQLHPYTWRTVLFLDSKRRLGHLHAICAAIRRLRDQEAGIQDAELLTPYPLDERERGMIRERLAAHAGGQVRLAEQLRPALIAGFTVQINDTLYDLSVASALRALSARWVRA
jgi:F-type H+-transporting ATPase subunit delta